MISWSYPDTHGFSSTLEVRPLLGHITVRMKLRETVMNTVQREIPCAFVNAVDKSAIEALQTKSVRAAHGCVTAALLPHLYGSDRAVQPKMILEAQAQIATRAVFAKHTTTEKIPQEELLLQLISTARKHDKSVSYSLQHRTRPAASPETSELSHACAQLMPHVCIEHPVVIMTTGSIDAIHSEAGCTLLSSMAIAAPILPPAIGIESLQSECPRPRICACCLDIGHHKFSNHKLCRQAARQSPPRRRQAGKGCTRGVNFFHLDADKSY